MEPPSPTTPCAKRRHFYADTLLATLNLPEKVQVFKGKSSLRLVEVIPTHVQIPVSEITNTDHLLGGLKAKLCLIDFFPQYFNISSVL